MEAHVQIGLAGPADQEAVLQLALQQYVEHSIRVSRDLLARAVAAVLADRNLGFIVVARDGPRTVGMAYVAYLWSLEHSGQSAWLEELFVIPEQRGHGIGKALVDMVVERVAESGCVAIDIEVDHTHSRAESFYRREGFTPLARARWVRELKEGPA
jgi:GNAT superfamily N-acetyltransferase